MERRYELEDGECHELLPSIHNNAIGHAHTIAMMPALDWEEPTWTMVLLWELLWEGVTFSSEVQTLEE